MDRLAWIHRLHSATTRLVLVLIPIAAVGCKDQLTKDDLLSLARETNGDAMVRLGPGHFGTTFELDMGVSGEARGSFDPGKLTARDLFDYMKEGQRLHARELDIREKELTAVIQKAAETAVETVNEESPK